MPAESGTLFIDDYFSRDMLYGAVCRASVPSGQIREIIVPDTVTRDHVSLVCDDIPGVRELAFYGSRIPVLADGMVRYVGEPFCLIAGPDEQLLRSVIQRISMKIEESEAYSLPQSGTHIPEEHILLEKTFEQGNMKKALESAANTVEGSYQTGTQHPRYSDPQGAFVVPGDATMTVYSSTQWPFHVRTSVADVLGIDVGKVTVKVPRISNHLDGKLWYPSILAAHAALLAAKADRPVRLILPASEDVYFGPRRAPVHVAYTTGVDADGMIVAQDITIIIDGGAYPVFPEEILLRTMNCCVGAYPCDNVRITGRIVRTNSPPAGTLTGFGLGQAFFALEMHTNRLAEISGEEPYTWKRKQIAKRLKATAAKPKWKSHEEYLRVMDDVIGRSDFLRKHAAYEMMKKRRDTIQEEETALRGVGISFCYQLGGVLMHSDSPDTYAMSVRLDDNERLHIYTSAIAGSKGTERLWKRTAGSILAIEPENIIIESVDSTNVPDSGPSVFSHNIFIITPLIEKACQSIQRKRFRSPLPIEMKKTIRSTSQTDFNVTDLFGSSLPIAWASSVVELEVNPYSFEVTIRGIWISVYCGEVILPHVAESTIESGVLHALEWLEHSQNFEPNTEGDLSSALFPGNIQIPPVSVNILEPEAKSSPAGIGELPSGLIPAAYSTALSQATGYYIDTIPVNPDRIFGYLEG